MTNPADPNESCSREHEYEELQKLRAMRRRFRTAELSGDEVEQIASAHMDPPRSSRQPSRPEIAMAGCNSKVLVVSYAFLRTAADCARASLYITALIVLHCQSRGTKQAVSGPSRSDIRSAQN